MLNRKPALAGVFAAVLLALAACTTPSATVSNSVLAAGKLLQVTEQTAQLYTDLPRCGSIPARDKPLCSDPALAAKMAEADRKAYAAVETARRNEALIGAALDAISAYQDLIPTRR